MSDSSTVNAAERTYDSLEERRHDPETLPTSDVLEEAVSALGGVEEFLVDPILQAVVRAVKVEGKLTNEQIGELVVWADDVYRHARQLANVATKVSYAARESYAGDELPLGRYGHVESEHDYDAASANLVSFPRDDA